MSEGTDYRLLPALFLRAPYYSFAAYDPDRMPEVLSDAAFRDAVFLASPQFYGVLESRGFDWGKLSGKERHTLRKYYNRMAFRPTPFGAFATFSLLRWGEGGDERRTLLAPDDQVLLHLRPDEQLRAGAVPQDLDEGGLLTLSPLLYRLGDNYRFIRSDCGEDGKSLFFLDGLGAVPFYQRLFRLFKTGARPAAELVAWIMREGACGRTEAVEHLAFLLRQQVLYAEQRGTIIGEGFRALGPAGFWQRAALRQLEGAPSPAALAAELERGLPPGDRAADRQYFYAAAERPWESGGPSVGIRGELERAVHLLQRLSRPVTPAPLQRFMEDFKAKFDLEKVPLLLALDPDAGLAYEGMAGVPEGRNLLGELRFPAPPEAEVLPLDWTAVHRFLLGLWKKQGVDAYAPLEISEGMLDAAGLSAGRGLFPPTTSVLFRQGGEHLLIEQAGGATATALIGRFGVFSEVAAALCRDIAALEGAANPGIVFADIGQFSDRHVDNINRRRRVYPYEIPLNVFTTAPAEGQLLPADLLLCVRDGELVLESARLGKRVIPRLASAYNHRNNALGIFRLLCDLQYQGMNAGLSLDLEAFFSGMNFYPRVYTGQVVLCAAKWKFTAAELEVLLKGEAGEEMERLQRFRRFYHLPQRVSLGQYDQQLVFDLSEPSEAQFFLECAGGLKEMTLVEYLWPGRAARSPGGPLAGQYVAFLQHDRAVYRPSAPSKLAGEKRIRRSFPPGSNWLYLKLYCTPLTADRVLAEVLRPLLREHDGIINSWFFIRYADPDSHLRLRFEVAGPDGGRLLAGLCSWLEKTGNDRLVGDLQGDTYRRELERYGPKLIGPAEMVFWRGSELVLAQLVAVRGGDGKREFRLGFATALFMVRFFLEGETAMDFAGRQAEGFLAEFKADKATRVSLDGEFRALRKELAEPYFAAEDTGLAGLTEAMGLLKAAAVLEPAARQQQLLGDLVHMQLNRTFPAEQRKQELLVWYVMARYLRSLKARSERG